jgi:hypothetical protein
MLHYFLSIFGLQIKFARWFWEFPLEWDDKNLRLQLLKNPVEIRRHFGTSILIFGFILHSIVNQWFLKLESLETYMLSFNFTILISAAGMLKLIMIQRSNKILHLFNSVILSKCRFSGEGL